MDTLLLLMIPPIITVLVIKLSFFGSMTWTATGWSLLVGVLLAWTPAVLGLAGGMTDIEVWNGAVTSKSRDVVTCAHSYSCRCRNVSSYTGSGSNRRSSITKKCDTCYEHSYDVDWKVHTTLRDWTIDRIDQQGVEQPPRWTAINPGDPVSITHEFVNYVKAMPDSLYHANKTKTFVGMIPPYPSRVYDYYKIDRALAVGVKVPDLRAWNHDIGMILRTLGPSKQVNVIVIFVNTSDQSYIHALEGEWIGGKKNDVIVVLGSTSYPKIDWVGISSLTDSTIFKIRLRDDIMSIGTIDRPRIISAIQTNTTKYFVRKQMAQFEYLREQLVPPTWALILSVIVGIVAPVAVTYMLRRQRFYTS